MPPESPPSLKEHYFHLVGETFLFESGYQEFFLETKILPHYPEIYRSWQLAVSAFDIGTPTKKLATDSVAEQDELDLFFIKLRHGEDPASALREYASLYQRRVSDPLFLDAIAKTIKARKERRPVSREGDPPLAYWIIYGWLYGFLWGLSNEDRAQILQRVYGIEIKSSDAAALIKKVVQRLKLNGWSDFRRSYQRSPFVVRLFREGEHEWCQILLRSRGQDPD
jgi:hypothetical protein